MAKSKSRTTSSKGSGSSQTKATDDMSTTTTSTAANIRKTSNSTKHEDTKTTTEKEGESPHKKTRLSYAKAMSNHDASDDSDDGDDSISLGSYRIHDHYVTIKIQMEASPNYLQELRDKYITLIKTLQEVDEKLLIKGVNVEKTNISISDPDKLPARNIGLNKYFHTTSKPPKADKNDGKGMIWATALIGTDETFDDLAAASQFDLEAEGIIIMKKRLQCFKSITPAYFQFLDNRADPDDIRRQIEEDIGEHWNWILFNRKPWEGYN